MRILGFCLHFQVPQLCVRAEGQEYDDGFQAPENHLNERETFTKRSFPPFFGAFVHFSLDKMVYFAIFGYRIGYRFGNLCLLC